MIKEALDGEEKHEVHGNCLFSHNIRQKDLQLDKLVNKLRMLKEL